MVDLDNNKLRLIFAGLVLIVLALIFLIFRSRFITSDNKQTALPPVIQQTEPTRQLEVVSPSNPSGSPAVTRAIQNRDSRSALGVNVTASPTPASIANGSTTKGGQTLPSTGAAEVLVGVLAISAMVSGFYLRKFPN